MNTKEPSRIKGCAIVFVIIVVIIISACAIINFIESRPDYIFRKFVADPIPASVTIHHSETRLLYAVVFLSFTISETDIEQIVKKHGFNERPYKDPGQEPSWFVPDESNKYWSADGGTKELWVSKEKEVAYFKQVNP